MNNQQKNKWTYYVTICMSIMLTYILNGCIVFEEADPRRLSYLYSNQSGYDIELNAYRRYHNPLYHQSKQFSIANNTTVSIGGGYADPIGGFTFPFEFKDTDSNKYIRSDSVVVRYINNNRCLYYKLSTGVLNIENYDREYHKHTETYTETYTFTKEEFKTAGPCKNE